MVCSLWGQCEEVELKALKRLQFSFPKPKSFKYGGTRSTELGKDGPWAGRVRAIGNIFKGWN